MEVEVDANEGGDGSRIRINGDTNSFRTLARLLTAVADGVDDPEHPSSEVGWHFALSDELPQISLTPAKLLVFNFLPLNAEDKGRNQANHC